MPRASRLETSVAKMPGEGNSAVFLFFSERLGCLGSIVLSLVGTLLLVAVLWRLNS